jgi:hypothetical protein
VNYERIERHFKVSRYWERLMNSVKIDLMLSRVFFLAHFPAADELQIHANGPRPLNMMMPPGTDQNQ